MAEPTPQTYQNHTRWVTGFHFVAMPILALNLVWNLYRLITSFSVETLVGLLLAVALTLGLVLARTFALAAQDRVIRLEERLRMQTLLPDDLKPRINEFTTGQLIALRFASDAELADLARKVLEEKIADQKSIKEAIKVWRPRLSAGLTASPAIVASGSGCPPNQPSPGVSAVLRRRLLGAPGVDDMGRPAQPVGGLQHLGAQARRQIRTVGQILVDDAGRAGRLVTAQRGVQPALGEEDVARPLNLLEQVEARADVARRLGRAQRVVQQAEGRQHPRLALPVGRLVQPGEEGIAHGAIGRQGRPDERERGAPVGIVDAVVLRGQDLPRCAAPPAPPVAGPGP